MGTECVRLSPKMGPQTHQQRYLEGAKSRFS